MYVEHRRIVEVSIEFCENLVLTVRRNNIRFKQLEELDVDRVERKDGIQIRLADFELDMHWSEALSTYATQHEAHCRDFAREVCERAGRDDLLNQAGPTLQKFIDYLASGLVKRDFRDLF
nr:hypothetical protein [Saliphagus infecundisoli]